MDLATICKTTVLKLQQLTGLLKFLCRVIIPEKAFTHRFYAKYAGKQLKQHYHVNVNSEMRMDAKMWLHFLNVDQASVLCHPFMDFSKQLIAKEIDFFTDASGALKLGLGTFSGGNGLMVCGGLNLCGSTSQA